MNVGAELARARNGRGLTLEQISDRTKVGVAILEGIEHNDLDSQPMSHLRGFVAAYAAAVGLDPHELGERYFALGELGEFESEEFESEELESEFESESTDLLRPASELPAAAARSAASAEASVTPAKASTQVVAFTEDDLQHLRLKIEDAPFERLFETPRGARRSPVSAGMFVLLPLLAAVVAFLGVRGLDRLWPSDTLVSVGERQEDRVPSDTLESPDQAADIQRDRPTQTERADVPDARRSGPPAKADRNLSREDASRKEATAEPASVEPRTPVDRSADVNGSWRLTNRVQSASYQAFEGMTLDYDLQLKQDGHLVTGAGEKRMENGQTITGAARTPITVEGSLDGRRLALRFTEQGTRRVSGGLIVMEVADDGSLRGSFSSDAADARGISRATRLESRPQ